MTSTEPLRSQRWQELIWFGIGLGLLLTIVVLLLFVGVTVWRVTPVLIGAAISFAGLAVSFFAREKATSFEGDLRAADLPNAKVTLAAYSPGIVGALEHIGRSSGSVTGRAVDTYALDPKKASNFPDSGSNWKIIINPIAKLPRSNDHKK